MKLTSPDNQPQSPTVGTRMKADLVDLLDAVTKRRGEPTRAATIHALIVAEIEAHFPGSTKEAA
jgi:hypothetical protein